MQEEGKEAHGSSNENDTNNFNNEQFYILIYKLFLNSR